MVPGFNDAHPRRLVGPGGERGTGREGHTEDTGGWWCSSPGGPRGRSGCVVVREVLRDHEVIGIHRSQLRPMRQPDPAVR